MKTKKNTVVFFNINSDKNQHPNIYMFNMMKVSPYSHKTEQQRLNELNKSVNEAKAALETFSYQEPQKHFIEKFKNLFLSFKAP